MNMYRLKYFLIILIGFFFSFGMVILMINLYYGILEIWMSMVFFFFGILLFFLTFSKYYVRSNIIEEKKRLQNNFQDYYNKKLNKILED